MMTLEKARKLLPDNSRYSDEELLDILRVLRTAADVIYVQEVDSLLAVNDEQSRKPEEAGDE